MFHNLSFRECGRRGVKWGGRSSSCDTGLPGVRWSGLRFVLSVWRRSRADRGCGGWNQSDR